LTTFPLPDIFSSAFELLFAPSLTQICIPWKGGTEMKRAARELAIFVAAASLLLFLPSSPQAFNSAAHIYIADQVFPYALDKTNLFYGTIAPDIAMYVDPPENWQTSFVDTHYDYIRLPYSWWKPGQKAFAKGWQIHNEIWGADHFAHGTDPNYNGYVIQKAKQLAKIFPLLDRPPDYELAHFAIEVAIDLLLVQNNDRYLGQKLLGAALLRSPEDLELLEETFVQGGRTDLATLTAAESVFRELVIDYGFALSLPRELRMAAISDMGVQIAQQMGVNLTAFQVRMVLETAMSICRSDYLVPIQEAISKIKSRSDLIR
jgi:hypothetical protein